MAKNGYFQIHRLLSGFLVLALCIYTPTKGNCIEGRNGFVYTKPQGDILVEYGRALDIICVLNDQYVQHHGNHASENLYFTLNSENISSELVEILNPSSVKLHIEKPSLSLGDEYACKLRNDTAVCRNKVLVGRKPLPVNDFECVGHNSENLTCTWNSPENDVETTYILTYNLPGKVNRRLRYSCPEIVQEGKKMSCLWTVFSNPQYRQAQRTFYFGLNMKNAFGTRLLKKPFSHFKHVVPNPPENLTYLSITTESVLLQWSVPISMQAFPPGLQHRVMYQSEYWEKSPECEERPWQSTGIVKVTPTGTKHIQFNLTGLEYAYARYDIRVSMRSSVADPDNESMWSKNSSIAVRTVSKVPGAPPKTNTGTFEVVSSGNKQRDVYVYWQQIPAGIRNGKNFKYNIAVSGSNRLIGVQGRQENFKSLCRFQKATALFCILSRKESTAMRNSRYILLLLSFLSSNVEFKGINLLPCTDQVTQTELITARNVLQDATPPGYTLENVEPEVTTGRNPHRWTGTFSRNDNNYNCGCEYSTPVKRDFKKFCPQGSEIRILRLINVPNRQQIAIEFLVNCYCTNLKRRRKRGSSHNQYKCNLSGYTTEFNSCI